MISQPKPIHLIFKSCIQKAFTATLEIVCQLCHHIPASYSRQNYLLHFTESSVAGMLDPLSLISTQFETNIRMQEGLKDTLHKNQIDLIFAQ